MPATRMLLSLGGIAFLASSPVLCQMPGPGGVAERARPPSVADWARPSRPARLEPVTAARLAVSDEKKRELEQQISKLKSICPSCAIGLTIGAMTIGGANVAWAHAGSCCTRDASAMHSFRAQEAKCAALPAGASDADCVLVSKGMYESLRGRYGAP